MRNSNKKIFSKKEGVHLFVFIGVCALIIFIVSITSFSTKSSKDSGLGVANLPESNAEFNKELNINDKIMENALEVKENSNSNFDKDELASEVNSQNVSKGNKDDKENKENKENNDNLLKEETDKESTESTDNEKEQEKKNFIDDKGEAASQVSTDVDNKEEVASQVSSNGEILFSLPVDGELIRNFSSDTLYSKTLDTWRTREGIDFKVESGSPVVAVLDGVVEKIDNDLTERGEYIVLKHEDGFKTMYTNLDKNVKVVNGQKVRKGEVIGFVGNSAGNYSDEDYGSHLNFVMYLNNEEVDPAKYIEVK